jgi:hypothetical protein
LRHNPRPIVAKPGSLDNNASTARRWAMQQKFGVAHKSFFRRTGSTLSTGSDVLVCMRAPE